MPSNRDHPTESRLFNAHSPFLDRDRKDEMWRWWLAYNGTIPNWDFIIQAASPQGPALVLIEAKAHIGEFDRKPKPLARRGDPDAQAKTDANDLQIRRAVNEASSALSKIIDGISISCDHHYQLSNRMAMAWKLASLSIPNALVFLGFTGDHELSTEGKYFVDDDHWHDAFSEYAVDSFPMNWLDKDIALGHASFRLLSRSLPAIRSLGQSPNEGLVAGLREVGSAYRHRREAKNMRCSDDAPNVIADSGVSNVGSCRLQQADFGPNRDSRGRIAR
jgi:hypothetical protein